MLLPGNASSVVSKTPCRFWMTDEGCKKGDKCRYTHTVLDPKENRCFSCSALGHGKRDCPVLNRKKMAKTQTEKGQKGLGKGNKLDPERNPQSSGSGSVENPSGQKPVRWNPKMVRPDLNPHNRMDWMLYCRKRPR